MSRHDEIHSLVFEKRQPWAEHLALKKEHDELVTASGEVGFHLTPIVTNLNIPKDTYSIGYFGTQGRIATQTQLFAAQVTGLTGDVVWSDPTIGGCAIPQYLRRTQYAKKTILNDRGFLSVCASRALLSGNPLPEYESLCSDVDNVLPVDGFVSKSVAFQKLFSTEVLNYFDGYVDQYQSRPELLLALGTVLTKRHTFRSIGFDKKLTQSLGVGTSFDPYKKVPPVPEGQEVPPATRPGLKDYLKKELKKIFDSVCPYGVGDTYNLDVMDFGDAVPGGDIMYCDFAWPWRDKRPVKEYSFPLQIATILTQKEPANTWYWDGDTILPGVNDFLAKVLPKFKFVIVNTQSSNFPDGPQLRASIESRFGAQRIVAYAYTDYVSMSGSGGKGMGVRLYREFYVVCKGDA